MARSPWPACEKCGKLTPTPYHVTIVVDREKQIYHVMTMCAADGGKAQQIPVHERTRDAVLAAA